MMTFPNLAEEWVRFMKAKHILLFFPFVLVNLMIVRSLKMYDVGGTERFYQGCKTWRANSLLPAIPITVIATGVLGG